MEVNDQVLVFEWAGAWQVAGLAAAVLLAGFLAWMGLRGSLSLRKRVFLLSIRGFNLLLVAILLLGPTIEHRQLTALKSRIALLVDASESMSVDDAGRTRIERVASFLEEQADSLDNLRKQYDLDTYEFADKLVPQGVENLGKAADGEQTDIVSILSSLAGMQSGQGSADSVQGRELAAVILISDGSDTQQLSGLDRKDDLPTQVQRVLSSLACPVNTVVAGKEIDFKDISITGVAFDDFAFIRNAVEVEVTLESVGMDEVTVPVTLERGGRNLATKAVTIPKDGSSRVTLRFVPDVVGKFVFRVTTPVLNGELIAENNIRSFATRIIRDKIRVLHVVGRPSWDQRFLREVLKRNPNVDLVSFYILRTTIDAPGGGEKELSLIPFPVTQLFGSELDTFDVLVFQNFNHGPYQVGFFLPQIAEYVRGGGGFCMIGGDLSFGSGGYGRTPLEDILPVRLRSGEDWHQEEIRPVVTAAGVRHPVLDLGDVDLWERLPPLGSYNRAQVPDPDSKVLLAHPFERSGSERAPILALKEVGRGRSAALLTDGSWRWRFLYVGENGGVRPYHRFWNNLLRWLIRDPALHPVSVRSAKARYEPGETIQLRLRAAGVPLGRAKIILKKMPGGNTLERRLVELDQQGGAVVEMPAPGTGAYMVDVSVMDGEIALKAQETFVIEGTGVERLRPYPRADIMKKIADASGGVSFHLDSASLADINIRESSRYRIEASSTRPLLEKWWILAGVITLLCVEWWMRRRWGFS